ncbi:MAG: hypothetical protein QW607_07875 [Desulfurococcaceae archaeon]
MYILDSVRVNIPNEYLNKIYEVIDRKENIAKEYYIKKLKQSLGLLSEEDKE